MVSQKNAERFVFSIIPSSPPAELVEGSYEHRVVLVGDLNLTEDLKQDKDLETSKWFLVGAMWFLGCTCLVIHCYGVRRSKQLGQKIAEFESEETNVVGRPVK